MFTETVDMFYNFVHHVILWKQFKKCGCLQCSWLAVVQIFSTSLPHTFLGRWIFHILIWDILILSNCGLKILLLTWLCSWLKKTKGVALQDFILYLCLSYKIIAQIRFMFGLKLLSFHLHIYLCRWRSLNLQKWILILIFPVKLVMQIH